MQQRHLNRRSYFNELANTSRDFYLEYLGKFITIKQGLQVLEIGCGEGGNLVPFAEKGCFVTGIDNSEIRISQAISFFREKNLNGSFICENFLMHKTQLKYDIILVHDVIEHIKPEYKITFVTLAKKLLSAGGVIFWGFPAWQMPFGGHQQICSNSLISHCPFIHLLPHYLYKIILRIGKENEGCINELLEIKKCGISIENFEKILSQSNCKIMDCIFWFINPHYKQKFGLPPIKLLYLPKYFRNFFCTSCFYITN